MRCSLTEENFELFQEREGREVKKTFDGKLGKDGGLTSRET